MWHAANLKPWKERRSSCVMLSSSNSKPQSENIKDKQARDANLQKSYEVVMMQEIQGVQNRNEGRMEEHERRVAQVIWSEAREALRGQRSQMLHQHPVLLQAGERENTFVKSQMHSELQSLKVIKRSLHDREVQQKRTTQEVEHQEAQVKMIAGRTCLHDSFSDRLFATRYAERKRS